METPNGEQHANQQRWAPCSDLKAGLGERTQGLAPGRVARRPEWLSHVKMRIGRPSGDRFFD
jgi:hypothetical protein